MNSTVTFSVERATEPRATFGPLHTHRFLFRIGLSIVNIFAWIFIFQYYFSVSGKMIYALVATVSMYCISQVATILLTPFSAAHLRHGVKYSIVYGAILAGTSYVYLGATLGGILSSDPAGWGIAVFALLLGAYRALYWVPYTLEAATASGDRSRMPIVYEVVVALMPVFAGLTLAAVPFGDLRLLFGAAAFVGLSVLPVVLLDDRGERFSWKYADTFRQMFAARHRKLLSVSFARGVEGAVLFLLWPIVAFLIVGSDYKTLGVILSATLFSVLMLRALYGRFMRGTVLERSMPVNTLFVFSGWMLRFFAGTPMTIFVADSYSYVSAPSQSFGVDPSLLEQSADKGSFLDEYTVLKEIGLGLGRVAVCAFFCFLLLFSSPSFAFGTVFIVAALAAAASVILERSAGLVAY